MYILSYKNRVIAGPIDWNAGMFTYALESVGIQKLVPSFAPAELPLTINADTKISECTLVYPEYNKKIQYIHGPFWDFSKDVVVGTFEVKETPLELIQNDLKAIVAAERYKNETDGAKITIQNKEVSIDTTRGARDIFAQKYLLMADNETVNWKFPEGWLTLTKAELGQIVNAAVAHIQSKFDWEKSKSAEIDAATTGAQLDAIVLTEE
jgi:hypothetical protein